MGPHFKEKPFNLSYKVGKKFKDLEEGRYTLHDFGLEGKGTMIEEAPSKDKAIVEKDFKSLKNNDDDAFESTVVETAIATLPAHLAKQPICDDSKNVSCPTTKLCSNERKITSRKRKNMFD